MYGKVIDVPFGSGRFLFNEETFGVVFHEIKEPMIARQGGVNQLQRLTHPLSNGYLIENGYFWFPFFPQSRLDHALKIPPVLKIILEKFGFSKQFIDQLMLTALSHDAPTPAGGNATMRLDKEKLCEVKNYLRFMLETGIAGRWEKKHGFYVEQAALCVGGEDMAGFLLNFLDRWSYTALDVFHLGKNKPKKIASLIKDNRFVMDVWRDVRIEENDIYFSDPYRLYNFLLLRALMHSEFYLNPYCRKLEHLFFSETKRLFDYGKITLEDLRHKDDCWLDSVVREGKDDKWCTNPHIIDWQCFESKEEIEDFSGSREVIYCEYIKPFETGLDWLVMHNGVIESLCDVLPEHLVTRMDNLSNERKGWYAYYFK